MPVFMCFFVHFLIHLFALNMCEEKHDGCEYSCIYPMIKKMSPSVEPGNHLQMQSTGWRWRTFTAFADGLAQILTRKVCSLQLWGSSAGPIIEGQRRAACSAYGAFVYAADFSCVDSLSCAISFRCKLSISSYCCLGRVIQHFGNCQRAPAGERWYLLLTLQKLFLFTFSSW